MNFKIKIENMVSGPLAIYKTRKALRAVVRVCTTWEQIVEQVNVIPTLAAIKGGSHVAVYMGVGGLVTEGANRVAIIIEGKPKTQQEARAVTPAKYPSGAVGEFKLQRLRDCAVPDSMCDTPEACAAFFREHITKCSWFEASKECFITLFLNTRRRIQGFNLVSLGGLDVVLVHPREVFTPALVNGAAAIVLMHNHPSGDPSPSEADIKVTRDLIRAGQLLKVEVLDHVIIGTVSPEQSKGHFSLRSMGYFHS